MPAAWWAGVPVVWHCRDLAGLGILGTWMYRAASRVIAISHTVARHLDQYAGGARGNKVTVIHNGIDPESLRGGDQGMAFRGEMGIAPEKFVVAIIGQMVPWKNHVVFLSAARRVAAEFPRAHFLIVGDDMFGEWAGYVESLKAQSRASGLGGRTTFAGFREDMGRVLGGIDVLVHPADREPFGRVIVESMAMGKPVVAVDRCGPAEIIRNGTDGILAKNADPDELAEGVLRLARDRAFYRKISASARARARNDFSLSRCVNEIRQVYDEVTETR
jgi:glycosyltransferase involved in cell wall biosynthesis